MSQIPMVIARNVLNGNHSDAKALFISRLNGGTKRQGVRLALDVIAELHEIGMSWKAACTKVDSWLKEDR